MIRNNISLILALLTILTTPLYSQDAHLDSLKRVLQISSNDTNKVLLLIDISRYNASTSPEDAVFYGLEAQKLSKELSFLKGEALALKYLGMANYFQAKYLETIQYWKQALTVYESIGDIKGVANMNSNIGAIYFNQGDDTKAIEFYFKSLKVAEEIHDSLRIATVLNNIGGVYWNKEATKHKSINYYLRAYDICQLIHDDYGIGSSAVNTGDYYLYNKQADSALFYLDISLEALKKTQTGNVSYALNKIGEAYTLKKDFAQAKKYQTEALELAKTQNSDLDMTLALISLGNTHNKEGDYKKAIEYYKQAEVIAREIRVNYQLKETFEALAKSYATLSDYEQAFNYQKLFSEIKDTLYNAENDKKIQRLQFNYDIETKQKEVDILTKDKELQALEVRRQKTVKNAFLVGLLLILIIAFILYRNIKVKIKVNKILDRQKIAIENLLLNILPAQVAEELQMFGNATPRHYDSASVLFTDFKGFSKIAEGLTPKELVSELNGFFVAFDRITEKFNLEKIKTIGDAYMCAGGIPKTNDEHPFDTVKAGLEMQKYMETNNEKRHAQGKIPWELRVGIHTGPIVAGVVGEKKYAYDIWGSTVNISSRMESNGEAGKLNISASTYEIVKSKYNCSHRGKIYAKNIGDIDMYFVEDEIVSS